MDPARAKQVRPADRANGEGEVVHAERAEDVERIGPTDRRERLIPVDVAREERDQRERYRGRDELAPTKQLAPDGELVRVLRRQGELLDARILDMDRGRLR